MLLHVFNYMSVLEMPALPLLYVTLSIVLVFSALLCYFYPIRVMSMWDHLSSFFVAVDRASSPSEQESLLRSKAASLGDALPETIASSDAHFSLQQSDSRN